MIGQEKLTLFVENISKQDEIPVEINILLTGKAGIGKTYAIKYMANMFTKEPDLSDCIEHHPKFVNIELLQRFDDVSLHIVDEVHKAENFEQFYDFMTTHLVIAGTNLPEDLPEAFRSRCINLVMENYSKEDLGRIVEVEYEFETNVIEDLVRRARGTPRDILQMASLMKINPETDLESLGYHLDGFRREDHLYIDYLEKVGASSLSRISAGTNLDSTLIQEFVEPFLLEQGMITITNRRKLNDGIKVQL